MDVQVRVHLLYVDVLAISTHAQLQNLDAPGMLNLVQILNPGVLAILNLVQLRSLAVPAT